LKKNRQNCPKEKAASEPAKLSDLLGKGKKTAKGGKERPRASDEKLGRKSSRKNGKKPRAQGKHNNNVLTPNYDREEPIPLSLPELFQERKIKATRSERGIRAGGPEKKQDNTKRY